MIARYPSDVGAQVLSDLLSEMVSRDTEVEACELLQEHQGEGATDALVLLIRRHEKPSLRRAALAALLDTLENYGYGCHAEVLAMCIQAKGQKPPLLIGG